MNSTQSTRECSVSAPNLTRSRASPRTISSPDSRRTPRAARHRERASVANGCRSHARCRRRAPETRGRQARTNVRVAPGDRLDHRRSLRKRHVVGPHEPVPAVSNLRTPADIDADRRVEGIRLLFGRALEHGQLECGHRRRTRGPGRRSRALRDPRELDVERRVAPVLSRLGLERDRRRRGRRPDTPPRRGSPRCDRATTGGREDRFEACPRITRRCEDRRARWH